MHVVIINGSPRAVRYSNTDKIIHAFVRGLRREGVTSELYAISERSSWQAIREAYMKNKCILIATPLFVENLPGLLLEFLGTLPKKTDGTKLSFILQGGFTEASQFRCGEAFLKKLPAFLGCTYGGCLVKGDNFSIRLAEGEQRDKMVAPYEAMGTLFAKFGTFDHEDARAFSGPEYLSAATRMVYDVVFKTVAKKSFQKAAASWGCTTPLDARPYERGSR